MDVSRVSVYTFIVPSLALLLSSAMLSPLKVLSSIDVLVIHRHYQSKIFIVVL